MKKLLNIIAEERYHIGVVIGIIVQVVSEMCDAHFDSVWQEIIFSFAILFVGALVVEFARRKK